MNQTIPTIGKTDWYRNWNPEKEFEKCSLLPAYSIRYSDNSLSPAIPIQEVGLPVVDLPEVPNET